MVLALDWPQVASFWPRNIKLAWAVGIMFYLVFQESLYVSRICISVTLCHLFAWAT